MSDPVISTPPTTPSTPAVSRRTALKALGAGAGAVALLPWLSDEGLIAFTDVQRRQAPPIPKVVPVDSDVRERDRASSPVQEPGLEYPTLFRNLEPVHVVGMFPGAAEVPAACERTLAGDAGDGPQQRARGRGQLHHAHLPPPTLNVYRLKAVDSARD